jgi:hypothetical protein
MVPNVERSCPETCETPLHVCIRTTIALASHAICDMLAKNVEIVRKSCGGEGRRPKAIRSSPTARNGSRRAYTNVGLVALR